MPYYNGRYYVQTIVKAITQYTCNVTGYKIEKQEQYLNIQVSTNKHVFGQYAKYAIKETFRVKLNLLGTNTVDQILDKLPIFLDEKEKKIKELEDKLAALKRPLNILYGTNVSKVEPMPPIESTYAKAMLYSIQDAKVTEMIYETRKKDVEVKNLEQKIREQADEIKSLDSSCKILQDEVETLRKHLANESKIGQYWYSRHLESRAILIENGYSGIVRRSELILQLKAELDTLKSTPAIQRINDLEKENAKLIKIITRLGGQL